MRVSCMYTPRVVDDVVVVVSATVDASNGSHVLQMHGLAFYTTTTKKYYIFIEENILNMYFFRILSIGKIFYYARVHRSTLSCWV